MRSAKTIAIAIAFLLGSAALHAQPAQETPPDPSNPPTNPEQTKSTTPRGQNPLLRRFGLTPEQFAERMALEADVRQAATVLLETYPNELIATIIDHTPVYRVTYVFSREVPASEIQSWVPSSIRRYLHTKRSRYTGEQIQERQRLIAAALTARDIPNSIAYDFRNDKFIVSGGTDEGGLMQAIPPELRSDVIVRTGYPSLFQTGIQPGDAIWGSWVLHDMNNLAACTYGFPVKTTSDNRQGILTAAHCPGPQAKVRYASDNHYVTVPVPILNETGTSNGRTYDYRVYHTTGLTSGPYVFGWNNKYEDYSHWVGPNQWETRRWANVHPELLIEGEYLRVVGLASGGSVGGSNPAHPIGAWRCKSGWRTGTTCGQITASSVAVSMEISEGVYQTYYGVVEFTTPDYMVSSYHGDSGGPVFTPPVWNGSVGYMDVSGAGVLVGGETRPN